MRRRVVYGMVVPVLRSGKLTEIYEKGNIRIAKLLRFYRLSRCMGRGFLILCGRKRNRPCAQSSIPAGIYSCFKTGRVTMITEKGIS